jgi:hypothetical protein
MVHSDPDTQREDLLRLLALIDDPRQTSAELRTTERRWLRTAEQRLRLDDPSALDAEATRRAMLAYRLLIRSSLTPRPPARRSACAVRRPARVRIVCGTRETQLRSTFPLGQDGAARTPRD